MEQIIGEMLNHISILNDEVGGIQQSVGTLQVDVGILKAQMSQILWLQRIVLGIVLAFIGGRILKLVVKNNYKIISPII